MLDLSPSGRKSYPIGVFTAELTEYKELVSNGTSLETDD
jgi:hypothetical protein